MNENKNSKKLQAECIPMQLTFTYSGMSLTEGKIEIGVKFETEQSKIVFEQVLSLLSGSKNHMNQIVNAETISLSPNRLQEIISRWYPTNGGLKKKEIIEDIIHKVQNRDVGEYIYECHRSKYKLSVSEEKCYLYNLLSNKIYCFVD